MPLPSVSVVVVTHNAAADLPACLDSVDALDYPRERLTTIVVDNASSDGTRELLAVRYPSVDVLPQPRNLGFAEANNVAAERSSADCLALLNADMRVDPSWLHELTALYDPAAGVRSVASLILDWEGRHVDFAGGTVNFTGHANQLGHGLPVDRFAPEDGAELLFPCGGAMLVERRVFLEAGGFDPSYFIYFEDVDLGWRLRLFGYRTRLAARARAYHRGHTTTAAFRAPQVRLLYERNALRTLIKNVDEENLHRLLAASLLLLTQRARLDSGSDRAAFDVAAGAVPTREEVERLGLAPLHAVADVIAELDELLQTRREIQRRRRVGDDEIFALFRRPFQPAGRDDDPYLETAAVVARAFGLGELFAKRRATRVLVVAREPDPHVTELALRIGRLAPATLAVRGGASAPADGLETVSYRSRADLLRLAREADVVVLDRSSLGHARALRASGAVVALVLAGADSPTPARSSRSLRRLRSRVDVVVARSPRERDELLAVDAETDADGRGVVDSARAPLAIAPALEPPDDGGQVTLRTLVEEPWRWRGRRAALNATAPEPATEETQLLLARLRRGAPAEPPPPFRTRVRVAAAQVRSRLRRL